MTAPRVALDLTRCHMAHQYGDITVFLSWFGMLKQPAMVLAPTHALGHADITTMTVPLSLAWQWAEETGNPRATARASMMGAAALGMSPNPHSAVRVLSIVRECLGDLLAMPPFPRQEFERAIGDMVVIDRESGRETYRELREVE